MIDTEKIKSIYRRFAETECKGYSDIYYRLARAMSEDDEVIGFIAQCPVIQPNLFLASVQLLTGPAVMPIGGAELRTFLKRHGREVAEVMRTRRTQTNEVGRCAVLLPALPPGPLALVEVGASAGLCLLLDQFYYEWGSSRLGDASSPVRLRCKVSGSVALPAAVPKVVWRRGLDLSPINVRDDDAIKWLLACVWPDHPERRRRLEAAIDLARIQPPMVSAGNLVDDLAAVIADVPEDAQLVVFHSAVLGYVSFDRRKEFAMALADASKHRDLVWLSNEPPGVIPELTCLAPSASESRFLLGRMRFTNGRRSDELLALAHPHGAELVWL
jgi:hypothetical protein